MCRLKQCSIYLLGNELFDVLHHLQMTVSRFPYCKAAGLQHEKQIYSPGPACAHSSVDGCRIWELHGSRALVVVAKVFNTSRG